MRVGYFLSSEQNAAGELIDQARALSEAGFAGLWISDHFHPWNDAQGHSPFVWSTIGALSQATERDPGDNRRDLSDGPHPPGDHRPRGGDERDAARGPVPARGRLGRSPQRAHPRVALAARRRSDSTMLEEAIEVIRLLWRGGSQSHDGRHYRVENARIYDLPDELPPILVSGFGPQLDRARGTDRRRLLHRLSRRRRGPALPRAGRREQACPGRDEGLLRRG